MNDKIKINEIFYSINGEGDKSGEPAVFIRTTGCNLRCNYCDTKYAFVDGKMMTVDEIIKKVKKYKCENVTLTGGEPLIQENIINLLKGLYKEGFKITIETNGSIDIEEAQKYAYICMDWKVPSCGEDKKMLKSNLKKLHKNDTLKIVTRKEDFGYIRKLIDENKIKCNIYLSPVFGEVELTDIVEYIKEYKGKNKLKMQIQLHKIIWNPDERGV